MSIFLDTSSLEEIKLFKSQGIIRGVTTNPTIIKKNPDIKSSNDFEKYAKMIAEEIQPYPLSLEVTSNLFDDMIDQAKLYSSWAKNINVKITIHGPKYENVNLKVINILENQENIRVNVTAMMSAQQCLLAMYSGASYVSLFGGRINNMGHSSIEEVKKTRRIIDSLNFKSKIIVGSVREVSNVFDWLESGAHIVTCTPEILIQMANHPYTQLTVEQFLKDAN